VLAATTFCIGKSMSQASAHEASQLAIASLGARNKIAAAIFTTRISTALIQRNTSQRALTARRAKQRAKRITTEFHRSPHLGLHQLNSKGNIHEHCNGERRSRDS
jgi:hypothetical protein